MMSTLTSAWWRVAAVAAAGVLTIPAWVAPAAAAPSRPDVGGARALRAALAEITGGVPRGSATGVDDGYPGGVWIAAGSEFSCSAGMVLTYCWGAGDAGQLGAGSTSDAAEPVQVENTGNLDEELVGAIAAGRAHTCALTWFDDSEDGGDLYCWGDNAEGQVGDGSTTPRSEPVRVERDVRQVATGADHTCAIVDDGDVSCWGGNDQGQLGAGSSGPSVDEPQPVPGLTDVIDLAAGGDTTCALDEDGKAWCWGADDEGQLGDGSGAGSGSATPVAVADTGGSDFAQIEVGDRHVCAVSVDAAVWCWGDDASGQLGDGAGPADPSQPVEVPSFGDVASVSAGGDSTCAVLETGPLYCWGANGEGQLGTGDRTGSDEPVEVDLRNVAPPPFPGLVEGAARAAAADAALVEVSVGANHTCALDVLSNAYCWGDNSRGQIGDGTTGDALVPVATTLVPDPATAVRVTPGDARLVVRWTPPADTGSTDLVGSLSVAIGEDDSFGDGFCKGEPNGCVIEDLTNGVEYQVLVVTQTAGGLSISAAVPGIPVAAASPAPVPGEGGGGQLPITGAAVSLLIAAGGALITGGLLVLRLVRRRAG